MRIPHRAYPLHSRHYDPQWRKPKEHDGSFGSNVPQKAFL